MTTRVGKYLLFETLGRGNFGKVKLGVHEETGEQVAVKIIEKEHVKSNSMTLQVKREVAIMKALHHQNIVALHEVLTSKTKLYLVMDLVKGAELFDLIAAKGEGGLPPPLARKYFQQLVDAVHYCHKRGVYHRDLKPENMLLDEDEVLKVTDFGLSAIRGAATTTDLLTTQCGTPSYIAPEIVDISGSGYDGEKVDAWACGVILFALLTGYLPFDGEDTAELFFNIQKSSVEYPNWLEPESKELIDHLLEKDSKKRWTMKEVKKFPWFLIDYTGDDATGKKKMEVKPISLYRLEGLMPRAQYSDRPRPEPVQEDPQAKEAAIQPPDGEKMRRASTRQLRISQRTSMRGAGFEQQAARGGIFAPLTSAQQRVGVAAPENLPPKPDGKPDRARPAAPVKGRPAVATPDSAMFRGDSEMSSYRAESSKGSEDDFKYPDSTPIESERIRVPPDVLAPKTCSKGAEKKTPHGEQHAAVSSDVRFEDASDSDMSDGDEYLLGEEDAKSLSYIRSVEAALMNSKHAAAQNEATVSELLAQALEEAPKGCDHDDVGAGANMLTLEAMRFATALVKSYTKTTKRLAGGQKAKLETFVRVMERAVNGGDITAELKGHDEGIVLFHAALRDLDEQLLGDRAPQTLETDVELSGSITDDEPPPPGASSKDSPSIAANTKPGAQGAPNAARGRQLQFNANTRGFRVDYSRLGSADKLDSNEERAGISTEPSIRIESAAKPMEKSKGLEDAAPSAQAAPRPSSVAIGAKALIFGRKKGANATESVAQVAPGFRSGLDAEDCCKKLSVFMLSKMGLSVVRRRSGCKLKVRDKDNSGVAMTVDVKALPADSSSGAKSEVLFHKDRSDAVSHFDSNGFVSLCTKIRNEFAAVDPLNVIL
eukprot:CAMPEP_0185858226 /NCGR_PEP_ID=MMETSP1354-20130828/29905_1 /TAXON_ID=708628 /ORGANISM="Erythrolobus madagascarensis, Strain CCMP3276" /LENGTH=881 /DNA_ID=CAMNT_0028560507 /DNA_START=53 /DNA_END=2699 /DNA_ORIENTATION=+